MLNRLNNCCGCTLTDKKMPDVGFEPTPLTRIELKSTALDHSANQAYVIYDSRGIRTPAGRAHQISNLAP